MRLAETTWFEYSLQWLYFSCQASPANSTLRPRSTLPSSRSQLPTYSASAPNSVVPGSKKSNFCTKLQLVDLAGSECVGELVILYACITDYWISTKLAAFFYRGFWCQWQCPSWNTVHQQKVYRCTSTRLSFVYFSVTCSRVMWYCHTS